jgi:hypothetical protein
MRMSTFGYGLGRPRLAPPWAFATLPRPPTDGGQALPGTDATARVSARFLLWQPELLLPCRSRPANAKQNVDV